MRRLIDYTLFFALYVLLGFETGIAQESERINESGRIQSHRFLFDAFIDSKKCKWSEDRSVLKEIVVFEGELSFEDVAEVELLGKSNKIAQLFDRVVIRGKDCTELQSAGFVDGDCVRPMRPAAKLEDEQCSLRTALTSRAFINGKVAKIECTCKSTVTISEIAFHSTRGIAKDAETFKSSPSFPSKGFDLESAFLQKVKEMSFAELSDSLSENSESIVRLALVPRLGSGSDNFNIRGILADRRVAKMHEQLSLLPPEAAAALSLASYETEFVSFKEFYNDKNMAPVRILHALEANLFLCSEFCTPSTFVESVESWEEWHAEASIKKNNLQFAISAKPDPLLLANLYTNLIVKKRGLSTTQANIWLHENLSEFVPRKLETPQLSDRWLMASDSTPNSMEVIRAVPTFDSYSFIRSKESQLLILNALKAELLSFR